MTRSLFRNIRNSFLLRTMRYFPYFGVRVYAPPQSEIVRRIAEEAIFERYIVEVVENFLLPETCFLDVGANIGAISLPALLGPKRPLVLSVECSPSTFPFLARTHANLANENWTIDNRAVSLIDGPVQFFTAGADMGAFDGLRDTQRGGPTQVVTVRAAPLDKIWADHGRPLVSVLKIDIEGGEFEALMSGQELIRTHKPAIIFEWAASNLRAYNRDPEDLFKVLEKFPGEIMSLPTLQVPTRGNLNLIMKQCEMFLLLPA